MAFRSTSHEQLDHLDEVNEGVNVANFEILQHGFHEIDEKEQDEVNEIVNAINFEIFQHGFHEVDEKKQEIVAQGGEWYSHDVEKWVRNLFDEWRRLKSYPTNINIVY
jgi:predicted 3-demethylubiquinone-9 3-methyltransferase (glyoxalase superfamily)